jgi:hypothetical protein
LSAPNDVPLTQLQQSPILRPAVFHVGGTLVGNTQYVDAFQRANFSAVDDHQIYHALLSPVKTVKPIFIDVPAAKGLALSTTSLGPPAFCAPMAIIDIDSFDAYLDNFALPALKSQGVNLSNFPIFFVHVVWTSPVTNLAGCCALGYHGTAGFPIQTCSPADFDSTGLFGTITLDTAPLSHEVAE